MERMNAWVEQYLRLWTTGNQRNWAPLLPIAEYSHNSWKHEATQQTPHELLLGYNPQVHVKFLEDSNPATTERLEAIQKAREQTEERLQTLQRHKDTRKLREYVIGEHVWLEATNLKVKGTRKLLPKRYGPFKITERIGPVAYWLDLPSHMKIHNVFHIDLLTPYRVTQEYGIAYERPPPILEASEEEYEIEAIRDMRRHVKPAVHSGILPSHVRRYGEPARRPGRVFPRPDSRFMDSSHPVVCAYCGDGHPVSQCSLMSLLLLMLTVQLRHRPLSNRVSRPLRQTLTKDL